MEVRIQEESAPSIAHKPHASLHYCIKRLALVKSMQRCYDLQLAQMDEKTRAKKK